eukprot:5000908-Ditylum_brightwellii.AAC.1
MLRGGTTRVIFPEEKKEATLTSLGDMAFVPKRVKHKTSSKGTRVCVTFYSFSEADIKSRKKESLTENVHLKRKADDR